MRLTLALIAGVLLVGLPASAAEKISREHLQFFEAKVRPILVQHCYQCHAEDAKAIKGGLLLDTRQGWLRGGDMGPAIVPGDPDDSLLIQAVEYDELEMPPKGKLSDSQIADLRQWVKLGAPDPREEDSSGLIKREIDIEAGRQYWAFQAPRAEDAPQVNSASWPANEIDQFVLAKLEAEGISPVNDASAAVLIRRLYFDLIGLPPTPEEVDAFIEKCAGEGAKPASGDSAIRIPQSALEELVDDLLAMPQFGERWGRHWLDVARYAESTGMERNITYPAAWRYRDYVIQSFNDDKPYDQFVREQIAGDLLPGTDEKNRDERLIATGFLAMGPKSLNERDRNVFVMDVVDEQIDVTTRAMMGVTVSCARCHDHKFDPFPQTDYYALAGIFRSSNTLYGATGGQGNRQASSLIPLGPGEKSSPASEVDSNTAKIKQQLKQAKSKLAAAGNDKKAKKQLKREIAQLNQQLKGGNYQGGGAKLPAGPAAMGLVDGNIADCRLHIRGNVATLGESVPRGFLQVVAGDESLACNDRQSGRLELAQYLTSADNPLTARVMANRTWHWLFGQGIVRTVDNFGSMGERPSNVELLDHLAVRFVADRWSVKKLVREIVLSRTYRLASDHNDENFAKDPENLLVWRQNHRRLDAESIRDAMLTISGELDRQPLESSPVAKMVGADAGKETAVLTAIDRGEFRHRSVYLPILRNALPEVLSVFDFAEPSIIVGRRQITTVPSQALFMLNSQFVVKQSQSLAERLLNMKKLDAQGRIEYAYRATLSREPTASELTETMRFADQFDGPQALAAICQALMASAEFRYIE